MFATDVSRESLGKARRGVYPGSIAADITPRRLARFFQKDEDSYRVKQRVRDVVTFAPHDILSDPPFPRIDFISCRNLFIYLEPHAQEQSLERFHFALRPGGLLWLGSAESVPKQTDAFAAVSSKRRLYRRCEVPRQRRAAWTAEPSAKASRAPGVPQGEPTGAAPDQRRVTRLVEQFILERHAAACAVINQAGNVIHLFGPTERYLKQPQGEVRMDLLAWARPGLYAALRSAIKQALERRNKVVEREARVQQGGSSTDIRITIEPIPAVAEDLFAVVFEDAREQAEARPAGEAVEATVSDEALVRELSQQLQDTQAELQGAREELDSVGEEYRSSYEELVSLNEELQSSNEELETTKEEAQSINEELLSVNSELEERNLAMRMVNADLENLLALTPIPIVFLDRDLRVRRFTPAVQNVMWLVRADVGRSIDHIKMRVDDDRVREDVLQVMSDLVPIEREVHSEFGRWHVRKVTPFLSDDRIDGVCITYQDITAQKVARDESEEARHYAEAIVRAARVPLLVLDPRLVVVSANAAFYRTFAVAPEETLGIVLAELGNGQWNIPRLRGLLERVIVEKRAVQDFEVEHSFETLGHRQMILNAALMERPDRPALILLSIEDVTQLRRAQQAAKARARDLEQEHRRKDEFLAMLGHELRNPLAALVSGLQLLERRRGDPEAVEEIRKRLARQTQRMTSMLDQLLDVSRLVRGKIELVREPVDLVDAARTAAEAVTPEIERAGHHLELTTPPAGAALVRGDSVRLIQVVENLLSNAAKYTENGGRIRLSVDAEGGRARIRVSDTGTGIDPELLPHIFDVFSQGPQQLARSQGGLGLGLPLVRLLVSMHGGEVYAYSEGPGQGSEFVVELPRLLSETAGDLVAENSATPSPAAAPRRVLVVDDERDNADMLGDLLRERGHEVRIAHDGPAALEATESFEPEVVLLDLGLPDMDGYEVAAKLRARARERRPFVVALTGYHRDPQRLRDAGFDDHLLKPPELSKLTGLLRIA